MRLIQEDATTTEWNSGYRGLGGGALNKHFANSSRIALLAAMQMYYICPACHLLFVACLLSPKRRLRATLFQVPWIMVQIIIIRCLIATRTAQMYFWQNCRNSIRRNWSSLCVTVRCGTGRNPWSAPVISACYPFRLIRPKWIPSNKSGSSSARWDSGMKCFIHLPMS